MKISEVSKKYDIPVDTLRYYEKAGLPIEVLKKYIKLFYEGDSTLTERKQILIDERQKLILKRDAIQSTIERLNYKINSYEETIAVREK